MSFSVPTKKHLPYLKIVCLSCSPSASGYGVCRKLLNRLARRAPEGDNSPKYHSPSRGIADNDLAMSDYSLSSFQLTRHPLLPMSCFKFMFQPSAWWGSYGNHPLTTNKWAFKQGCLGFLSSVRMRIEAWEVFCAWSVPHRLYMNRRHIPDVITDASGTYSCRETYLHLG